MDKPNVAGNLTIYSEPSKISNLKKREKAVEIKSMGPE